MRHARYLDITTAIALLLAAGRLRAHLHHSGCGTGGGDPTEISAEVMPKRCSAGGECVAACAAKDAGACYFLGFFFNHAGTGHYNDPLAHEFFQLGCDAGSDKACRDSGNMSAEMIEPEEWRRAQEGWERACLSGGMNSCAARAMEAFEVSSYWKDQPQYQELTGFSRTANLQLRRWRDRAIELAAAGCRSAETEACHLLASLLPEASQEQAAALVRETRLSRLDCAAGDAVGCVRVENARNTELRIANQAATPDDEAGSRANELFLKRCDADGNWLDCYNYFSHARLRDYGDGATDSPFSRFLAREEEWEKSALKAACDNRQFAGCLSYADLLDMHDKSASIEILSQTCDEGSAQSCLWLARKYAYGEGVAQNFAAAAELYEANCGQGGCWTLASIYAGDYMDPSPVVQDRARARIYLERGCRAGEQDSCNDIDRGTYADSR